MRIERPREEWEIRDDARALARAEEIKADKGRLREAQDMAKKMADEEIKRVSGILKVAGKPVPKNPNPSMTDTGDTFRRRAYSNPATIGRL